MSVNSHKQDELKDTSIVRAKQHTAGDKNNRVKKYAIYQHALGQWCRPFYEVGQNSNTLKKTSDSATRKQEALKCLKQN